MSLSLADSAFSLRGSGRFFLAKAAFISAAVIFGTVSAAGAYNSYHSKFIDQLWQRAAMKLLKC